MLTRVQALVGTWHLTTEAMHQSSLRVMFHGNCIQRFVLSYAHALESNASILSSHDGPAQIFDMGDAKIDFGFAI